MINNFIPFINNFIPLVVVGYFLFFIQNKELKNLLVYLIFVSFFTLKESIRFKILSFLSLILCFFL